MTAELTPRELPVETVCNNELPSETAVEPLSSAARRFLSPELLYSMERLCAEEREHTMNSKKTIMEVDKKSDAFIA